jgi:hypothetical protein
MTEKDTFKFNLADEVTITRCKFSRLGDKYVYLYICFDNADDESNFVTIQSDGTNNELLNHVKFIDIIDIFPLTMNDECYVATKSAINHVRFKEVRPLINFSHNSNYMKIDMDPQFGFFGALTGQGCIDVFDSRTKILISVYVVDLTKELELLDFKMISNRTCANCFAYTTRGSITIYNYLTNTHKVVIKTPSELIQIGYSPRYIAALGYKTNTIYFYDFE